MNYDGKVVISTALDNSGLQKGVNNISGSFGGLKSVLGKLTGMIATAFSVTAVVQFGVASSKAAMSLENALLGLQSIVEGQGRSFSKAQAFIEEYTKDGLIPATNAITAYKNLASRGYDDSQIKQVMVALKDASAFGRQASMSMGEAVQSASEGLKNENSILVDNAGVTKNVAKMWEDYAKSIGTTANNLTQQQKIQAEVTGILEESKYQTGDAAKVASTLSGQLQQLSFNFNNLKVAVGNVVNPIAKVVIPVFNAAIVAITRFANTLAAVSAAFFGGTSKAIDNYTVSVSGAADAEEDLADGISSASKAAKKALAGFDELNVLQDKSSSGSTSGGSVSVEDVRINGDVDDQLTEQVEGTSASVQKIIEKIQELIEPLKNIDLTPAKKAFDILGSALADFGGIIAEKLEWAWYNILAPLGEWTIENVVSAAVDTLGKAFEFLGSVIEVIWPTLESLWNDFLSPLAEWAMTNLISSVVDVISAAFNLLGAVIRDIWPFLDALWSNFLQPIAKWATDLAGGILTTILNDFAFALNHFAQVINYTAADAYILSDAEKELAKSAREAADGFKAIQDATAKDEEAISREMTRVSNLAKELDGLADAAGRVNDEDVGRVKFILEELNKALGTEYTLVGNTITNYQNLRAEIEKVIAAKKANLLLEAHEDDYLAAVEAQEEAWDALQLAEKQYLAQRERFEKKQAEVLADIRMSGDQKTMIIEAEKKALADMRTAYDKAQSHYKTYTNTINGYEMAHQMILEENYEGATDILLEKNAAYTEHADTVESESERAMKALEAELSNARRIADQTRFGFEQGMTGYTQEMVEEADKAVQDLETEFYSLVGESTGIGSGMGESLADGLREGKDESELAASEVSNAVASELTGEENKFKELGETVGESFSEGLLSMVKDATTSAGEAINKALSSLNNLFGKSSGSSGPTSTSPRASFYSLPTADIPHLAKGSVIPPNAPFMAVLGDQKRGTNVEAPLSTIQEAVAAVMQDYNSANLAGHEATVAVLRDILEAVLGIEIGDDTIAGAVDRYNRKMAVVRGG